MKHLSLAFIALTIASCGSGTDAPVNESPVEAAEIVNPFEPINGGMQDAISEPPVTVPQDTPVDTLIEPVLIADPVQPVVAEPEPVVTQPEPQLVDESQIPNDLIISPIMTSQRFREEWRGSENPSPFVIVDIGIQWEPMQGHTYWFVVGDDVQTIVFPGALTLELEYPGLLETFDYSQIPTIWVRMCVPSACYDAIAVDRQPELQSVSIESTLPPVPVATAWHELIQRYADDAQEIPFVEVITYVDIEFLPGYDYYIEILGDGYLEIEPTDELFIVANELTYLGTVEEFYDSHRLPNVKIRACNETDCTETGDVTVQE